MKKYSLMIITILCLICCMKSIPAYACVDLPPRTNIYSDHCQYTKVGEAVIFYGGASDLDQGVDPTPDEHEITGLYWQIYKYNGSEFIYQGYIQEDFDYWNGNTMTHTFNSPGVYALQLWADDNEGNWLNDHWNTTGPFGEYEYLDFCLVAVVDVGISIEDGVDFIPVDQGYPYQTYRVNLTFSPSLDDLCREIYGVAFNGVEELDVCGMYGYLDLWCYDVPEQDSALLIRSDTGQNEEEGGWWNMDLHDSAKVQDIKNYLQGNWYWYVKGMSASNLVDSMKIEWKYYPDIWNYTTDTSILEKTIFDAELEPEHRYLPYGTGMNFYYKIKPYENWNVQEVYFGIFDEWWNFPPACYEIYEWEDWEEVGDDLVIEWDGKDNILGSYDFLPPGNYHAAMVVYGDGFGYEVVDWEEISFTIYEVSIEANITEPAINGVRSGLDLSTLRFELNGTVINNTLLSIDETYSDSILTDLSIQYCDPSIYSIIVSGNNTIKVDIDDKVDNHMNQIIQTFYLP